MFNLSNFLGSVHFELHPKSWTQNFWGAVHYDTASLLVFAGFSHDMVRLSAGSLDARVRLKIPATNAIPNATERHI